jgi:hypothetical protein
MVIDDVEERAVETCTRRRRPSRVESRAFHFSSLRSASSSICSSYTFDATLAMNATGIEIASARSKHTLGAESGPW